MKNESIKSTLKDGSFWEEKVGYARGVRIGGNIEISGTTATENGEPQFENDPYNQTKLILNKILKAVSELGATKNDIIRTRVYVTDISNWKEVGKAHKKIFNDTIPATSMVEVSRLINSKLLVEIEAMAIVVE